MPHQTVVGFFIISRKTEEAFGLRQDLQAKGRVERLSVRIFV